MRNDKRKTLYNAFIGSYIVMLLIPFILGSVLYVVVINIVKDNTVKNNYIVLENSMNIIDAEMQKISNMTSHMTYSSNINQLFRKHKEDLNRSLYYINEANEAINNFTDFNDFIEYIYIYYHNLDIVVSSNNIFLDPSKFYDIYFKFGNRNIIEWSEEIKAEYKQGTIFPEEKVFLENKKLSTISFLRTLPIGSIGINSSTLHVLIDIEKIINLFQGLFSENSKRWIGIVDKNHQLISSINKNEIFQNYIDDNRQSFSKLKDSFTYSVEREKMMISYITSPYNGWKYIVAIPVDEVMFQVQYIYRIAIIFTILIIAFGVFLAIIFSRMNVKPIMKIVNLVDSNWDTDFPSKNIPTTEKRSTYQLLQGNVEDLINRSNNLKERLEFQQPILRNTFLRKLFLGTFKNEEEIYKVLEYLELEISASSFIVIIIHITGYDEIYDETLKELEVKRSVIEDAIYSVIGSRAIVFQSQDLEVALLFESVDTDKNNNSVSTFIRQISKLIYEGFNINVNYSISNKLTSLMGIGDGYSNAKKALRYNWINENKEVIQFDEVPVNIFGYDFPIETELRIITLTKSGEKDHVIELLDDIFDENVSNSHLPPLMVRQLLVALLSTAIRIFEQINFDTNILSKEISQVSEIVFKEDNLTLVLDRIKLIYIKICDLIIERKKSSRNILYTKIVDFINKDYKNHNLSLTLIADQFSVSEVYLSKFYKEQSGCNLFSDIENLRMTEAKKMLINTKITVDQIASECGFNSSSVFRRAFKRYSGLTPSQYRNI